MRAYSQQSSSLTVAPDAPVQSDIQTVVNFSEIGTGDTITVTSLTGEVVVPYALEFGNTRTFKAGELSITVTDTGEITSTKTVDLVSMKVGNTIHSFLPVNPIEVSSLHLTDVEEQHITSNINEVINPEDMPSAVFTINVDGTELTFGYNEELTTDSDYTFGAKYNDFHIVKSNGDFYTGRVNGTLVSVVVNGVVHYFVTA